MRKPMECVRDCRASTVSKLGQDYLDYYRKRYGGARLVEAAACQ